MTLVPSPAIDMTTVTHDSPAAIPPLTRWEWVAVGGLLLLAAALRFSYPGQLAVGHFDEGVYASNIWFGDRAEGTYPAQHLYAPPLLPVLIELGFVFFGPCNSGAMWPAQVAGTVSVLLLWWLGRCWFGRVAGLVAAALCATNEVHLLLSRSALTDALLGMWWLAAILFLRRACDTGRPIDRLVAGLLIGLAWFTKYNGWMPLGIALGAVLLRGVLVRGIWNQTRTALTSCIISGAIGLAAWSPWLWSLQAKGGYASVAANHRQYIVGPAGWTSSAVRQYEQLAALLGPLSKLGFDGTYLLLLLALVLVERRSRLPQVATAPLETKPAATAVTRQSTGETVAWVAFFGLASVGPLAPVCAASAIVVLALLVWWCGSRTHRSTPDRLERNDLGYWILLVWFGGMLVATPLYSPYLRLTLPAVLATCLGVGLAFEQAWQTVRREYSNQTWFLTLKFLVAAQLLVVGVGIFVSLSRTTAALGQHANRGPFSRSLPDQSSLPLAARQIAESIGASANQSGSELPAVVYVYAEPSLLFQLRNAGLQHVAPVSSLQFARSQFSSSSARIYLAVGIHALHDPTFREQFEATRGQFKRVGSWPWQLSPLVALDQPDVSPQLLGRNPGESATVELYEVLPP